MLKNSVIDRKKTHEVNVGGIKLGGCRPVVVQSMTNTDTADVESTVEQVIELADAGSEIVRLTVNNEDAAKAVPHIKDKLLLKGYQTPLAGCFHYNGHSLLNDYPDMARALDKYRINPGNVGFGSKHETQFASMIESALKWDKAVRIGVNWGSLDKRLASQYMDENAQLATPFDADSVLRKALVESAIQSAQFAESIGLEANKIILSCKVSRVQDLISVYRYLAHNSSYALHLGLTEAGVGSKAIVASTAALSVLLQEGIGDTIRISLTPSSTDKRSKEVQVAQEILQTMGLRSFSPMITACPGCGRTTSTFFIEMAEEIQLFVKDSMPTWKEKFPGVETLDIAVMGCIVNGPGESKHADIGISLPGTGEDPSAPVFIDGKKHTTLKGHGLVSEFKNILSDYIEKRFA